MLLLSALECIDKRKIKELQAVAYYYYYYYYCGGFLEKSQREIKDRKDSKDPVTANMGVGKNI